jgi:hypothetical protein
MKARMDNFVTELDRFKFKTSKDECNTLRSTFEFYKSDTDQIFKLFNELLVSLPHVPEHQCCQLDVASFLAASAALTLATYNTVQFSKLESSIKAQKHKTDLLMDISKLHEHHLHKLDSMVDDIGKEIQVIKVKQTFILRLDLVVAQITSDSNQFWAVVAIFEWIINSAFDQKLALACSAFLSSTQLWTTSRTPQPRTNFTISFTSLLILHKVETSFIHWVEEQRVNIILHVPFVEM